jgi:hypothetical protein
VTNEASTPTAPLVVHVERNGAGSASFDWDQVRAVLELRLGEQVAAAIGRDVEVVGIRFLDGDGRDVAGPAPFGITLVGFTASDGS